MRRVAWLLRQIQKGALTVSAAEQDLEERGLIRELDRLRMELEINGEEYA